MPLVKPKTPPIVVPALNSEAYRKNYESIFKKVKVKKETEESTTEPVVKRKPGRPPKVEGSEEQPAKRKPGRPKGSGAKQLATKEPVINPD